MIGIEGGLPKPEPSKKEKCTQHPLCDKGSCGFYLDKPHGWQPEPISVPGIHLSREDHEDIVNWSISYQTTHHHIVAITDSDWAKFKKWDKRGIIELPMFVKPETPIQAQLRSQEVS